jgi:probable rRNA maturation factor
MVAPSRRLRPPCCARAEERGRRALNEHVISVICDDTVDSVLISAIERAAGAALCQQGVEAPVELSIALVTSQEIRELNRRYRQVDAETDVLSFGMDEGQGLPPLPGKVHYLGDIAISVPRAAAQAQEYGHSAEREFGYLTAHGVLHLLGHDHHEPAEQRRMRQAEEAALAVLGLVRDGA